MFYQIKLNSASLIFIYIVVITNKILQGIFGTPLYNIKLLETVSHINSMCFYNKKFINKYLPTSAVKYVVNSQKTNVLLFFTDNLLL